MNFFIQAGFIFLLSIFSISSVGADSKLDSRSIISKEGEHYIIAYLDDLEAAESSDKPQVLIESALKNFIAACDFMHPFAMQNFPSVYELIECLGIEKSEKILNALAQEFNSPAARFLLFIINEQQTIGNNKKNNSKALLAIKYLLLSAEDAWEESVDIFFKSADRVNDLISKCTSKKFNKLIRKYRNKGNSFSLLMGTLFYTKPSLDLESYIDMANKSSNPYILYLKAKRIAAKNPSMALKLFLHSAELGFLSARILAADFYIATGSVRSATNLYREAVEISYSTDNIFILSTHLKSFPQEQFSPIEYMTLTELAMSRGHEEASYNMAIFWLELKQFDMAQELLLYLIEQKRFGEEYLQYAHIVLDEIILARKCIELGQPYTFQVSKDCFSEHEEFRDSLRKMQERTRLGELFIANLLQEIDEALAEESSYSANDLASSLEESTAVHDFQAIAEDENLILDINTDESLAIFDDFYLPQSSPPLPNDTEDIDPFFKLIADQLSKVSHIVAALLPNKNYILNEKEMRRIKTVLHAKATHKKGSHRSTEFVLENEHETITLVDPHGNDYQQRRTQQKNSKKVRDLFINHGIKSSDDLWPGLYRK